MAYLLGNTTFLPGLNASVIFFTEHGSYAQQALPKKHACLLSASEAIFTLDKFNVLKL